MESEFSPDKALHTPAVPIKTYQWEDLRRAREAGGYPWTHLLKPPLEGDVTAEDILRESTPRRSMSREVTRSRTHSPVDMDAQRILNLDSSPGSSRKHGDEGEDEGVQIPNFSKEVSLDTDENPINRAINTYTGRQQKSSQLVPPVEIPKNISPKSILKRRTPEPQFVPVTETREKTKCCHPLVNKIKHLADKTLHKLDKNDNEKSPLPKRKRNEPQEIRQLKSSPGAVRRQKFSAIKLGDSDEMSKTLSIDSASPPRKKKEHIYEDIEESKTVEKCVQLPPELETNIEKDNNFSNQYSKECENVSENKSNASQDPSLYIDDNNDLRPDEHVMEHLHKLDNHENEALVLDFDNEEPNIDEIFQNQLDEVEDKDSSPNITITEIIDDDLEEDTSNLGLKQSPISNSEETKNSSDEKDWSKPNSKLRRWTSEGGTPIEKPVRSTREGSVQSYTPDVRCACQFFQSDSLLPERLNPVGTRPTSRTSNFISNTSDHEYEIIEKQPPHIVYTTPSLDEKPRMLKNDDELSSTTSLERKYLQHISDEEEHLDDDVNDNKVEGMIDANTLQKDIEDRYFVNTPSTVSRTECDVSTSQVDSSALENLPLKRENRIKNSDNTENKLQIRLRESTGKLKSQAGKLKTKLQNIKTKQFSMPDRPKIKLPDRPKFKMPDRPKISFPDRPKFSLPDRRKFSLPDRPKFKKINISEKLSLGDRKKFTFPDRPKFNVPELPKFKLPERPKINFPSLGRKKEYKTEMKTTASGTNIATVEFEAKTYPRLFHRKKKPDPLTSSSPTLNRADTPPPTFTFSKVTKVQIPVSNFRPDSPAEPREYGNIDTSSDYNNEVTDTCLTGQFDRTYDFDKIDDEYIGNDEIQPKINETQKTVSISDMSPSNREYTHVINEINNDEFFVRPRGISRENIQVREYLSDEIRQAFKIPKNALALMGSSSGDKEEPLYANEAEADPELLLDENEAIRYSTEDLNDKDDGYYTFPPVRPSRSKRKKKEAEQVQYIDDDPNANLDFTDIDLELSQEQIEDQIIDELKSTEPSENTTNINMPSLLCYECDDDVIMNYSKDIPLQSQTLPAPPKRKKKIVKKEPSHSSFTDVRKVSITKLWESPEEHITEDVVVYRTEHEYIIPDTENITSQQSPIPPRRSRNRSRSSHGTSLCDDDRTSQGADSLTLDINVPPTEYIDITREIRHESPGYATVDKSNYVADKIARRPKSKTPPCRRRKSHSSERKYYTVSSTIKDDTPNRPPRKKSSTSLMTLDSMTKRSMSGDITPYVEIDEPHFEEIHKDLKSGEIISKMKDRPLPPPPRPPRGPRRKKNSFEANNFENCSNLEHFDELVKDTGVVEFEVSTQTDPLPDDVDFELGLDENLDVSMSSSLRDIIDEEHLVTKSLTKLAESPRQSRPVSRSEKSIKLSDPKIAELSKSNIGRTSPTVILVERRVSSPTRINEREEIVTEASLTVQHIDVDESVIPDVPPLPRSRITSTRPQSSRDIIPSTEDRALERIMANGKDVQLDNLVTQRLQVKDLDVGRLNVSELQASKILVSDIEGMTLQVNELDSKSGHLSVSGIEFSQSIIDEIVKKFAEISTANASGLESISDTNRPVSREEETQTEEPNAVSSTTILPEKINTSKESQKDASQSSPVLQSAPPPPSSGFPTEEMEGPPQRPPPPDLTPLLYTYLQDLSMPPASFYHLRTPRERPFTEFHESQQTPPPPTRRSKRKPAPQSESSSDESRSRPSPRRMPTTMKPHEPTIAEAGAQFFRVCQNSINRTLRNMLNSLMSYISGTEDKKDVQMALVIFLVLVAGLIMFGLSDSRTIHHHHWEFFNPPDGKQ